MKKNEIKIGRTYHAKVSGKLTTVRVDAIDSRAPLASSKKAYGAKTTTVYRGVNLATMRTVVFKSAQKFLAEVVIDPAPEDMQAEIDRREGRRVVPPAARANVVLTGEPKIMPSLKDKLATHATTSTLPPHGIVKALAGTGKTTTLVEGLKVMMGLPVSITPSPQQAAVWELMKQSKGVNACFVAFNKSIATELQRRVPSGVQAMTMHSMGFKGVQAAFGRVRVTDWRTEDVIAEIMGRDLKDIKRESFEMVSATKKLVSMCKNNLTNAQGDPQFNWEEALLNLADYYDVEMNGSASKVIELVPQVLNRCKNVDRDRTIDFDDMVWLPVVLNLPMSRYDVLLVDESQDLNRSRQALAKMCGKRLILCGDEHQAIYGFAGADASSMARMEEELTATPQGCVVLPLTVTRRCGKAIVEEAKAIVPEFEAHESNCAGKISRARFPDRLR